MQILLQESTYSSGYKVYLETCFLSPIVKRKTYNYQNNDIKVKRETVSLATTTCRNYINIAQQTSI